MDGIGPERTLMRNTGSAKMDKKWWRSRHKRPQLYIDLLVFTIATAVITLTEFGLIPGTKLGFTCGEPLFSHKYNGEVVTPVILGVTGVVVVLGVISVAELLAAASWTSLDYSRAWYYLRQCIVGGTLTLLLTEVAKTIVSEHRPHFFDVCEPDTAKNCTPGEYVFDFKCTSSKYSSLFMVDASRSFPSGHSSTTVFAGLYCTYILHSRLPISKTGELMRPFLIAVVLTWTFVCSLTRITDRRHHWWDVLCGSVLGAIVAWYYIQISRKVLERRRVEDEMGNSEGNMVNRMV